MTRPGTLCRATRLAAVICHAVSPVFNQAGFVRFDMADYRKVSILEADDTPKGSEEH
jgi:hypothetical protein